MLSSPHSPTGTTRAAAIFDAVSQAKDQVNKAFLDSRIRCASVSLLLSHPPHLQPTHTHTLPLTWPLGRTNVSMLALTKAEIKLAFLLLPAHHT